jgi:hypothetical protein
MTDRLKVVDLVGGARVALGLTPPEAARRSRATASVLIFRPVRPRRYIEQMARTVIDAPSADHGELYLRCDMQLIEQDLLLAGAEPAVACAEARAIESAIRAEVWKLVLTPDRTE